MFHFNTEKAIQATATLLRLDACWRMGRKRLLALLYLADRRSLQETGRPIVGGRLSALKFGPIHSQAYDLIKGSRHDEQLWSKHFRNDGYHICLADDPGSLALSRYEVDLLNELTSQFQGDDDFDVAAATHTFGEYQAAYVKDTSQSISFESIIDEVIRESNMDKEKADARKESILRDAAAQSYFDGVFSEAAH